MSPGPVVTAVRVRALVSSPVLVGIAVFLLGLSAVLLTPAGARVAAWWPAAGMAVAATAVTTGRRRGAVLVAIAVASVLANLAGGRPVPLSCCYALANTAEAALAGWLLARRGPPVLASLRDLGTLFGAAAAGAVTAGALAGTSAFLLTDLSAGRAVAVGSAVAAAHAAAVVVLVPAVLALPRHPGTAGRAETAVQWVALVTSTVAVFAPGQHLPLGFVPLAALVWTGLRARPPVAVGQLLVVGALAAALTAQGGGPFAAAGRELAPSAAGALVQLFVVACALVVLALAVLVAQREEALAALARRHRFDGAVLESVHAGVLACDADGTVLVRNRTHRSVTGVGADEDVRPAELAARLRVFQDGEPVPPDRTPLLRALAGEELVDVPMRMGPPGRPLRDVVATARPLHAGDGSLLGAVAAFTDVTAERGVQEDLRRAVAFRDAVLAAGPDPVFVMDLAAHRIDWTSRSLAELLGVPHLPDLDLPDLVGLVHPDDRRELAAAERASVRLVDGDVVTCRLRMRWSGGTRWVSWRVTPFARDGAGRITRMLGVARDVTESVAAEERLERAALHDPLTGLPNRRMLADRLSAALHHRAATGGRVAVLFCDLDGFKNVNDSAGHATGDVVLRIVAGRLAATLHPRDTVARVGGDEFVVVLDGDAVDDHEERARSVARRIGAAVADPVRVDGVDHRVGISVGTTLAAPGDDPDDVLHRADRAMYRVKRAAERP